MLKYLSDILSQPTAHAVGQKRVLGSLAKTDTNLTQIAHNPASRRSDGRTLPPDYGGMFLLSRRGSEADRRRKYTHLKRKGLYAGEVRGETSAESSERDEGTDSGIQDN